MSNRESTVNVFCSVRAAAATLGGTKALITGLAALLLLSACSEKPADLQKQSAQHLLQATTYARQGQYRAAMIEARNAIQKTPQSAEGYIQLARIFNELAQGKQALAQLELVPENQRASAGYQATLAEAYLQRRKFNSARRSLQSSQVLAQESPVEYQLLEAQALVGLGELQAAGDRYRQALAGDADNVEALLGLAKVSAQQNDFHRAFEPLAKLEQLAPKDPQVLLFKASLAFRDGDLDKTESLLTEAIAELPSTDVMTPLRASVLRALTEILTRQGHSAEALVYTKILAEAFPGVDEANDQYRQALEQYKARDFEQAEQSLVTLLEDFPQFEQAAQLLGLIYYIQGDFEKADQYFAEHLDPELANQKLTNIAAMANLRLREPEKVLALLEEQIPGSDNAETLSLYGLAALAARQSSKGEAALLKAVSLAPERVRVRLALAQHYNNNDAPQKALQQLQSAYAQDGGDPYVQSALTLQYLRMGQREEAGRLIEEVLAGHPQAYTSQMLAGDYHRGQGDMPRAVGFYRQAAALNPSDLRSQLRLGLAQLALGDYGGATAAYTRAMELAPQRSEGYKGLITAYEMRGDAAPALDQLEVTAAGDGGNAAAAVLAEYYARRADFKQAAQFEQVVVDRAPEEASTRALSASIAFIQGNHALRRQDYAGARAAALRGLTATPQAPLLLTLLTQAEILSANYAEAEKIIAEVREFNEAVANHLSGDLHAAQSKPAAAVEAYRRSWEALKNDTLAAKLYSLLKAQQPQRATEFLTSWSQALPDSRRALLARTDEHLSANRYRAAIPDLEKAVQLQPDSPVLLNNLAWAYNQVGSDKAVDTAARAYGLAPDNAAIADTYGLVLFENGDRDKALLMLRKAVRLAPDNAEIRGHLQRVESAR